MIQAEQFVGLVMLGLIGIVSAMPVLDWWQVSHLPPTIKRAVTEALPQSSIQLVVSHGKDDQPIYVIQADENGIAYKVRVSEDGHLLQVERYMGLQDVPADVREVLRQKLPGAAVRSIVQVTDAAGRRRYIFEMSTHLGYERCVIDASGSSGGAGATSVIPPFPERASPAGQS